MSYIILKVLKSYPVYLIYLCDLMEKRAFDFLDIYELPKKPRKKGIIEIRGPYYSSITYDYLKGILHDWSNYFDGYKFAGGSERFLSRNTVKDILDACHDHDVYVSTGGFVERIIVQGPKAVDQYIKECKSLGFDVVEVSSGFVDISLKDKVEIVKQVQKMGMKAKPEVSFMYDAGGGTHRVGYEGEMRMRKLDDVIDELSAHIKAGVDVIMIESEGLTEDLPSNEWRLDLIKKITNEFGFDKFMFEASDPPVFKWYLKKFGRDVNLFIDYSQLVEFNAWRAGLWGDEDIWKGKKYSYSHTK